MENANPAFTDTTLLHSTFAISFEFFHQDVINAVTVSCIPPELRTSPRYDNLPTFF